MDENGQQVDRRHGIGGGAGGGEVRPVKNGKAAMGSGLTGTNTNEKFALSTFFPPNFRSTPRTYKGCTGLALCTHGSLAVMACACHCPGAHRAAERSEVC